MSLEVQKNIW